MKAKWIAVAMGIMLAAATGFAANRNFTGLSGVDMNFSTSGNWDVEPVAADNVWIAVTNINGVATSSGNRAKIDSGFSTQLGSARIHSQTGFGQGMSYAEVLSGGLLKSSNLYVGNPANAAFDGSLILRSGGLIDTAANNSGTFSIGGETVGMVGEMFVEAGAALFRQSRLELLTYGTLTFEFGSNSVSTLQTVRTTTGVNNTLNGLLQVDLAALITEGAYTLIDSSSANLLIAGNLKTVLDNAGGKISGTGNYSSANFAVLNGGTMQWELTTADGGQDLVFNVIPEPATLGLFIIAGIGCLAARRLHR